ncbi:ANTAR domain-containing response regulator [Kordiimonas lacus]|uniref:Response regulator receiver and ANTAR domain protein n=1 Tax=Kordiimonas lacus TaxID=637679 RepID=A0A1G7DQQ9_9PROT|nr:ANTAR domain-containing protein [Kordiimonas lacus]SDE53827.1 response regulator receiver and ANTAR domain protein [Kordiimonas lacus]
MADKDLNILVIDEDPGRAMLLEEALVDAGYTHVVTIQSTTNLHQRIAALAPDMVIVDLQNPDRDTLEGMFQVTKSVKKPIAMFVDQSDGEMIRRAVEAGVSAYVVDGLKRDRVQAVVDVAVNRFETFQRLTDERDAARNALADRKTIDRAKGLLMQHRKISEDDAYKLMRGAAMKQSRKLVDIAQSIITAMELDAQLMDGGRDAI